MHKVPDENVFSVGYISGCIPILRQYCRRRQLKELDIVDAIAIAMTLNELTGFMFINGIEIKARQKLLRDLKIVEMLIKTLQVPFSESCVKHVKNAAIKKLLKNQSKSALHDYNNIVEPEHQKTMVVVNAAFRVLDSFLKGNSRKNELYISRHVPILWSMFGTEMKVEPMFNELVRDNLQIILLCGEEEIKFIVQLLKENKCADFLEFLSVLSVCDGTPVTEMQNLIGKHLLELKEPPVFLTDVNSAFDGTIDVRGVEGSGQQVNVPVKLHEFAREALKCLEAAVIDYSNILFFNFFLKVFISFSFFIFFSIFLDWCIIIRKLSISSDSHITHFSQNITFLAGHNSFFFSFDINNFHVNSVLVG